MIMRLNFESNDDFQILPMENIGYSSAKIAGKAGVEVFFEGKMVARCFRKHDFYGFLDESKINWPEMLSQELLPDEVTLVIARKTLFVIDVSYQNTTDVDDEELMLCDFKRKQYLKLVSPLGLKVEYVYVLNDWFKKPEYKDVLDYIHSVNCHYRFNELPLAWLGLPVKKNDGM